MSCEMDLSPVSIGLIKRRKKAIVFNPPLLFQVTENNGRYFSRIVEEALGMDFIVVSPTREELIASIEREVKAIWNEYVHAPRKTSTLMMRYIKEGLLSRGKEVYIEN